MHKVKCEKCGGRGEIPIYRGIAGGVCFSCCGKGYKMQKSKPHKKALVDYSRLPVEQWPSMKVKDWTDEMKEIYNAKVHAEAQANGHYLD